MKWLAGISTGLVCAALVTVGTLTAAQAQNHPQPAHPRAIQEMRFVVHEDGLTPVQRIKGKNSLGDLMVVEDSMYDIADKQLIGHINAFCVRTQVGAQYECNGTIEFADNSGQISFEGPFKDHENGGYLTVIGGTQAYDNVHGQFQIIPSETKDNIAPSYQIIVTVSRD